MLEENADSGLSCKIRATRLSGIIFAMLIVENVLRGELAMAADNAGFGIRNFNHDTLMKRISHY